jgi:peptide/nickel transport system permease protein
MWKTVLRRVLIMIPEIIILSVFVFILAKMMPGDPFTGAITPQTSPARIHELKVQAGLYDPWYVQYGRWIRTCSMATWAFPTNSRHRLPA